MAHVRLRITVGLLSFRALTHSGGKGSCSPKVPEASLAPSLIASLLTFRVRHERQREREAELISTLARLEEEKETLSRGLVMAQERFVASLDQ